jgi:C-terminal processing protease CtpA/Prc
MLAELKDMHVWVEEPGGRRHYPHRSSYSANYDHRYVRAQLLGVVEFQGIGFVGRTNDSIGVAVIQSLPAEGDYETLRQTLNKLRGTEGFIVDLRACSGGSELRAAEIAGFFAARSTTYARSLVRSGGELTTLREATPRVLEPTGDQPYRKPVVCLIGPGCVSSGEGFALMMKSLSQVTLLGQPTRGASGNPAPVTLSNGVQVWFSRWVSLEMDGTPIEGRGVLPHARIEHPRAQGSDVTFQRAWERLR